MFSKSCKNLTKALEILSDEELDTLYDLLNKVYKKIKYFFLLY